MGGDTSQFRVYEKQGSDPEEKREAARLALEKQVIRLQDELDKLIKLYSFSIQALENELLSGLGYKQMALGEKEARKLKELSTGMNSLVETKIKYDKAQKQLAAVMTPAEEKAAVVTYILSLGYEDRNEIRHRLSDKGVWVWRDNTPEGPK